MSVHYRELPNPIEKLAEKSNLRVYKTTVDVVQDTAFVENDTLRFLISVFRDKSVGVSVATMLPFKTTYKELENKRDAFIKVIKDVLGLGGDNYLSFDWSFDAISPPLDWLLSTEEQALVIASYKKRRFHHKRQLVLVGFMG